MNDIEIKTLLHEGIKNTNDENAQPSIKNVVDENNTPPDINELSQWQIDQIESAKRQIEMSNFMTGTEADNVVDEWLNE